jgi:hypothetical protein
MGKIIDMQQIRERRQREWRLWLILRYLEAFDEADHDTLSAILTLAVDDPELEQLIDGVHEEMLQQEPMPSPAWLEEVHAKIQDLLS